MSGSNLCTCTPLLEIHIAVPSSSFQTQFKCLFLSRGLLRPVRTAQALRLLYPYHIHDYSSVSLFVQGSLSPSGLSPLKASLPLAPRLGWTLRCLRGAGNNRTMLDEHKAGLGPPPSLGSPRWLLSPGKP